MRHGEIERARLRHEQPCSSPLCSAAFANLAVGVEVLLLEDANGALAARDVDALYRGAVEDAVSAAGGVETTEAPGGRCGTSSLALRLLRLPFAALQVTSRPGRRVGGYG